MPKREKHELGEIKDIGNGNEVGLCTTASITLALKIETNIQVCAFLLIFLYLPHIYNETCNSNECKDKAHPFNLQSNL